MRCHILPPSEMKSLYGSITRSAVISSSYVGLVMASLPLERLDGLCSASASKKTTKPHVAFPKDLQPKASNRKIAKTLGVHHSTVAAPTGFARRAAACRRHGIALRALPARTDRPTYPISPSILRIRTSPWSGATPWLASAARRPCDRTSTCVSPARFSRQVSNVGTNPARLRLSRTRGARSSPMPTIKQILLGLVLAVGIVSPGQVFADRAPTPEERFRIETMLRNEGFTRWGHIELDDEGDLWGVYDAYASDGRKYDLKLDPDTLAIIEPEAD